MRHFGQGAGEEVLTYPLPSVRLVDGVASYLHGDQLGSVRMVTDAAGGLAKRSTYRPFGEISDWGVDPATAAETKGFVGERFDADAGLQYLNARYFDPQLALFLQPDWFEVTKAGVGTNRYAYSFNDPVNLSDPGGNFASLDETQIEAILAAIGTTARAGVSIGLKGLLGPVAVVVAVLTPTAMGNGELPRGAALTQQEVEAGFTVDGGGRVRNSEGRIVRDKKSTLDDNHVSRSSNLSIGSKIAKQMGKRGWDIERLTKVIDSPVKTFETRDTRHNPDGTRNDARATAYYDESGNYVVVNNETGDVVQVSNINDPAWKDPNWNGSFEKAMDGE